MFLKIILIPISHTEISESINSCYYAIYDNFHTVPLSICLFVRSLVIVHFTISPFNKNKSYGTTSKRQENTTSWFVIN